MTWLATHSGDPSLSFHCSDEHARSLGVTGDVCYLHGWMFWRLS